MNICPNDDIYESGAFFLVRKERRAYILSIQSMTRMDAQQSPASFANVSQRRVGGV
jgi:hypothetical protein